MTDVKPIALVKTGSLSENSRKNLSAAGYAVIESDDPECVKVLFGTVVPFNGETVWRAAFEALSESSVAAGDFGRLLAKALAEREKA